MSLKAQGEATKNSTPRGHADASSSHNRRARSANGGRPWSGRPPSGVLERDQQQHHISLCEGRGMARKWVGLVVALLALGLLAPAVASAQGDTAKVLIYSGTTGYRHANSRRGDPTRGGGADPGQAGRGRRHQRLPDVQRARHRRRHHAGLPQHDGRQPRDLHRREPRAVRRDLLLAGLVAQPRRHHQPAAVHRPPSSRRSRSSPARAAASARCTRP